METTLDQLVEFEKSKKEKIRQCETRLDLVEFEAKLTNDPRFYRAMVCFMAQNFFNVSYLFVFYSWLDFNSV